ncbi:hypothetical protein B0H14DRAFT_2582301 [Mycena olivaceomarginata]|nr:hypothetical protein B0H14DRAFT_2582301 [Mycena olivaceomarginata]
MNCTLETIQFHGPSTRAMSFLFPSEGKGDSILTRSAFPNLRSLQLQALSCDFGSHYSVLVRFLYSESHLCSFNSLVWATNPFLDSRYFCGPPETFRQFDMIGGHVGTKDQNYATIEQNAVIIKHPFSFIRRSAVKYAHRPNGSAHNIVERVRLQPTWPSTQRPKIFKVWCPAQNAGVSYGTRN